MLRCLAMSTTVRDDLLWRFAESDDPEIQARDEHIVKVLLAARPHLKQRLIERSVEEGRLEGKLAEARVLLCQVLARRQLVLSPDDEARVEACTDLATLERWLDQAVTAASSSEALW